MTTRSRELSRDETEALGRELDELRARVLADLGQRDIDHIRGVIRLSHQAELVGRGLLHVGIGPTTFVAGAASLAVSKILENMEIGHNVMHGQYDWARDPLLNGHAYDWDMGCATSDWHESHNFEHHTFTNVLGRDRDIGYAFLRVTDEQAWHPSHLFQPLTASALAFIFQWGIGTHNLRIKETIEGQQSWQALWHRSGPFVRKAAWQLTKDYMFYPALALWNAPRVAAGNLLANGARNVWSFAIIFCGHFSEGTVMFREEDIDQESRGAWYVRQINGSANIEGGRVFHVLSGHLSHQIEHHLFPEIPASRYPEMAPRVKEICERFGQVYNTASFRTQLTSVARRLFEHALPPSRSSVNNKPSKTERVVPAADNRPRRATQRGIPTSVQSRLATSTPLTA